MKQLPYPPHHVKETLNIEEIFLRYDFLLMDNCILHQDSTLSDELYDVRTPEKLSRFKPRIESMIQMFETIRGYLSQYKHVHITPEVKNEIAPLANHLRNVAMYNQTKCSELERELQRRDRRPRFSRKNKFRNKVLEMQREEDFDLSNYTEIVRQPIELLQTSADILQKLAEEFPIYQRKMGLPQITIGKASPTDASMLAALFDYIQKPENQEHQAAILTADGDLIQLYHSHFATLTPSEQVELPRRTAVYFREPYKETFLRFEYHPSWKVRETAGNEKESRV